MRDIQVSLTPTQWIQHLVISHLLLFYPLNHWLSTLFSSCFKIIDILKYQNQPKKTHRFKCLKKPIPPTDSKYNNVDKDWIDVKSNNYFSNEEFQDYPTAKVDLVLLNANWSCVMNMLWSRVTGITLFHVPPPKQLLEGLVGVDRHLKRIVN